MFFESTNPELTSDQDIAVALLGEGLKMEADRYRY